ncbi:MAG TPA: hypothetical protein ENK26_15000 [Gammaproteobacteria bacterium]|nr:hypothetical protein [Gammaproteobacteria bacterium]
MNIRYQSKVMLRHLANNTLGRMHYRRKPGKPNILVFSNRRGGSTWLIELLSAEKNTKRVVEIFDTVLNANPYRRKLPEPVDGFFVDLDQSGKEKLFSYFRDIESGRKVFNTQWKFWKEPFNFRYDRVIFKIFYAKNYIRELRQLSNSQVIFQMRHPIPTAMSILKNEWPSAARGFVHSPGFRARLDARQVAVVEEIVNKGTDLERHVAGWFLENFIPMSLAPGEDWLVLRYEDMVMQREETIELLARELDLECAEAALERYRKPSYNAFDSEEKIRRASPEELCNGWKDGFDWKAHPRLPELFSAFPNPWYDIRGTLSLEEPLAVNAAG